MYFLIAPLPKEREEGFQKSFVLMPLNSVIVAHITELIVVD